MSAPDIVEAIPLLPRRRLVGSAFGGHTSVRRGSGIDVAGSRPYRPGDHFHAIDWKASARLSSARGTDEFIVRDRFAEEMPRTVIVCDRRPEMALFPPGLPWLRKPEAVEWAALILVTSAVNERGLVGYLDYASHGEPSQPRLPFWRPPRAQASAWGGNLTELTRTFLDGGFDAPADNVQRSLELLSSSSGSVPAGSFIFVLSDFLVETPLECWTEATERGWDVVPVVVQDPLWERSFPPIGGVTAPFSDATGGRLVMVRLTEREAAQRRQANEARFAALLRDFADAGLDPVLVWDSSHEGVRRAFLSWADLRFGVVGRRT